MKEQHNYQHLKTAENAATIFGPLFRFNENLPANVHLVHPAAAKEQYLKRDFNAIINYIVEAVQPEKIFCLSHQTEPDHVDFADLVIIIPEGHPLGFKQIEEALHLSILKHHRLSCTLFTGLYFDRMIKEGHIYYARACNADSLMYDNGYFELPDTDPANIAERIEKAEHEFTTGMKKAHTFLANADSHRLNNLPLAPFLLEQSAELCLRTLIKALTGQTKRLPNLKALLHHCLRFSPRLPLLLSDGGTENERLLALLEMAGTSYRHADNYTIGEHDLDLLFERVKKLHVYAAYTFDEWLTAYHLQFLKPAIHE